MSIKFEETSFSLARDRGMVWVCDIENSSGLLNDKESVLAMEQYLPRLHWLGRIAISAASGRFIKWTGDGFLGWFPIDLHRDLGEEAAKALRAIWHLSILNNVTRLGVDAGARPRLRHGLTMEHDALVTSVADKNGNSIDLIGRSIVLAFRLAGIRADFPNVVTQREIVEAASGEYSALMEFRKLRLNAEDRLRYFKGQQFGTRNLYESKERRLRKLSRASLLRTLRKTIARAENLDSGSMPVDSTVQSFIFHLQSGPEWTREVLDSYVRFWRNDVLSTLKKVERLLDSPEDE